MKKNKGNVSLIILGVLLFVAMVSLLCSIGIIRAGQRGVLLDFGAVQDKILGEGLHFIVPIKNGVVKVDVRTLKLEVKASAFSKDLQAADAIIALNYHIDASQANKLWQEIGRDYKERIIEPAIQEVVKATTAKFNAQMLIEDRAAVKKDMVELLSQRLSKKYIIVDDVSIVNFDFSDDYERAIEEKQVAQQSALKAENVLRQRETEAKQRIVLATAEAEAIRIQAQSISAQGGIEYVSLKAVEKWDGRLPVYITSGSPMPFIQLPNTERRQ
jgi:regulator of protease activity HflC (stomatin/prohibitin superfamily)